MKVRYINLKTEKQKGEPYWGLLGLPPWVFLVTNVEASAEAALMCFFQLVRLIAELDSNSSLCTDILWRWVGESYKHSIFTRNANYMSYKLSIFTRSANYMS